MTEPRDEFDSPWKDILEAYFQQFMQFFFPQIHNDVDWSRGYDFWIKNYDRLCEMQNRESG